MSAGMQAFMEAIGDECRHSGPKKQRPIHEAQIAELDILYQRYKAGCRFKPGDYVMPANNAPLKNRGEPNIVLEVLEDPLPDFEAGNLGTIAYGSKTDMRVGRMDDDGDVAATWVESCWYIPYARGQP